MGAIEIEPRTFVEVEEAPLTMGQALQTLRAAAERVASLAAQQPDNALPWFDRIVEAEAEAAESFRSARRSVLRRAEQLQDESLQRAMKFYGAE
jgi:hypothetical protein